ncbi:hypothetical protein HL667_03910 [Bradyrhizobium sp. 83012]|uniref:Uncharacterized protein n=1 Tax=Bradyrhizobium aeschynomenes TaxID=2734909 RepID=A0ABX2C9V0_9BRAD|nr:hypothetical protein [Bradyrhizobium aeschynomenes]NPU15059.1 hypothetical protein [Bradyrhizobium aeschynomenes]NPU64132.1 hypothetical protein [Bradyrhizobium aeschynomenes]NPV21193.1 hypothetical protein [Bradyrhizobium aeschynomenes]
MTALRTGIEPVRGSPSGDSLTADVAGRPAQVPMAQQNLYGSHGYDMHPQELVRLSGCQELKLRREKKRALLLS